MTLLTNDGQKALFLRLTSTTATANYADYSERGCGAGVCCLIPTIDTASVWEGALKGLLSRLSVICIFQIAGCLWPQPAACTPQATSSSKAPSTEGERVVLSIGDQKMTAAQVEKFIQALPPNYRAFYAGEGKRLLPANIIRTKVLSAEAVKEKLDQQPDVALAIEIARESILADAARKHIEESTTVSDQELRDLYEKDKAKFEEVRIAHILIRTDDAALKTGDPLHPGLPEPEARKKLEDIRKQILAGADFGEMARKYSEDAVTARSGGDMGIIRPDKVAPPIIEAAHSLELGQVSDLIPTPAGFEIIKVEQKRTIPFEEAKAGIESQIRQSKANETLQHLMEQSGAYVDQEFFSGSRANQNSPAFPPAH